MQSENLQRLSTRRIKSLPNELINQIAAGEVVERPASVIKELVENSLDAGSLHIDIHVTKGGTEEILILDDGSGIEPEDLPICAERHTTSKLSRLEDLDSLSTYGFRDPKSPSKPTAPAKPRHRSWEVRIPSTARRGPRGNCD
jgi:DNA mismatch repair protein MutL